MTLSKPCLSIAVVIQYGIYLNQYSVLITVASSVTGFTLHHKPLFQQPTHERDWPVFCAAPMLNLHMKGLQSFLEDTIEDPQVCDWMPE